MPVVDNAGDTSYCAGLIRRYDSDRYRTVALAPKPRRDALFALYAFNLEVARTTETVTEPMIGRIRLQWWRECIAGIYAGTVRRPAVVEPLAHAVQDFGLSRSNFDRLIDAREFDLDKVQPPTADALVDYAEATSSSLVCLALEILGVRDEEAKIVARHVGIAWAIIGLLRAVPFHARSRRAYLPGDMTQQAGLSLRDVFDLKHTTELANVLRQLSHMAKDHLRLARQRRGVVPTAAIPAFWLAPLADGYLKRIERADYDVFGNADFINGRPVIWRLGVAAMLGRY